MQSKVCFSVLTWCVCIQSVYVHLFVFLDVYVFGIGGKVNKDELNSLASKKHDEEHLFILKDYEVLGDVFNRIISE